MTRKTIHLQDIRKIAEEFDGDKEEAEKLLTSLDISMPKKLVKSLRKRIFQKIEGKDLHENTKLNEALNLLQSEWLYFLADLGIDTTDSRIPKYLIPLNLSMKKSDGFFGIWGRYTPEDDSLTLASLDLKTLIHELVHGVSGIRYRKIEKEWFGIDISKEVTTIGIATGVGWKQSTQRMGFEMTLTEGMTEIITFLFYEYLHKKYEHLPLEEELSSDKKEHLNNSAYTFYIEIIENLSQESDVKELIIALLKGQKHSFLSILEKNLDYEKLQYIKKQLDIHGISLKIIQSLGKFSILFILGILLKVPLSSNLEFQDLVLPMSVVVSSLLVMLGSSGIQILTRSKIASVLKR